MRSMDQENQSLDKNKLIKISIAAIERRNGVTKNIGDAVV